MEKTPLTKEEIVVRTLNSLSIRETKIGLSELMTFWLMNFDRTQELFEKTISLNLIENMLLHSNIIRSENISYFMSQLKLKLAFFGFGDEKTISEMGFTVGEVEALSYCLNKFGVNSLNQLNFMSNIVSEIGVSHKDQESYPKAA